MEGNFKIETMGSVVILTDKRTKLNTSISQLEDFEKIQRAIDAAIKKIKAKGD